MLDQSAVGLYVDQRFDYSWRDVIIYALSVGAGADELQYVYEKGLKVLPTFAVVPCIATFGTVPYSPVPLTPTSKIEGLNTAASLHMDHHLVLHKAMPIEGSLDVHKEIVSVYDRGKDRGAKITMEITLRDRITKELYATNTLGFLNLWGGGFGGDPPPHAALAFPDRDPDYTEIIDYPETIALLYRLTGDTFPIHADPEYAKKMGHSHTIAHGLCGFGYCTRTLIGRFLNGDPANFDSAEIQFRSPAIPGDRHLMSIWKTGEQEVMFRLVSVSSGKAVLDYGRMKWKA